MRMATKKAISASGLTAQSDHDSIGRCIIMACNAGLTCPNEMAAFALHRFWRANLAMPFEQIRGLLQAPSLPSDRQSNDAKTTSRG